MKVVTKNQNENPFYGKKACLKLFSNANQTIEIKMLDDAYAELETKEDKDMFYSLLFSIGDVTAREHNIFKGAKVDNGGNANRDAFYTIFVWLLNHHKDQFIKFLNAGLFNEYSCFDVLFKSRVQTKNGRVVKAYDIFANEWYRHELANYIYKVLNGTNIFDKLLVAKFLTPPRMSKRSGHNTMLEVTRDVMKHKALFLAELSALMGWEFILTDNYANFNGYRAWRQAYNHNFESVLFSSGEIKNFTKVQFIDWVDKLPARARFRVRNRLFNTEKYPNMMDWYTEWEKGKEAKQAEKRVLEEKVRQGTADLADIETLKKVKKEAKVTTGATNFKDIYNDILTNRVDKVKLESFMDKINLPYNSLVIIDDSGSMTGKPFNFATFMASVCLCKNPDDDGRNLLGFFNNTSRLYAGMDKTSKRANSLMTANVTKSVKKPFVDPTLSFYDNYKNIDSFCRAVFQSGGTNISSIPDGFKRMMDENPQIKDDLMNYPIWTIISDGEWNNLWSPEASINDFFKKCERYFGFRPFIIAIDVPQWGTIDSEDVERFSGIENMMYIPANPAQIEQLLTNFNDMDVYDIYTPLQSLYRSNRYQIVRENVL